MKDIFSKQSDLYARYRPAYPAELFNRLLSLTPERTAAWDCGTGNGQVAVELARYFERVEATDISENQLKNAIRRENIFYTLQPAEQTSFPDSCFDLITVAQAIHWFDFPRFYKEVCRVLKPEGVLAVTGYARPRVDGAVDPIIDRLHDDILGTYWEKERRYVDDHYRTIPFPFEEIAVPPVTSTLVWEYDQLIGYINTWSSVQKYKERNNASPVDLIVDDLGKAWGDALEKEVRFPILMRVGKLRLRTKV